MSARAAARSENVFAHALSSIGKLVRTTAFKLSLAYLVTFLIFAFVTLGYVAWNARRVLDEQILSTIEAEINGLSEQYRVGGLRRLVAVVERRSKDPGASLYLITTPTGERIAGNVGAIPLGLLARPGRSEAEYGRSEDDELTQHRAIVQVFILPGGFRLLVGRDVDERRRLHEVIQTAFGYAILFIGILGCAGGWFITRRVLKRVDDMTETTRTIMNGDLSGRLRISGADDELDRLAQNLNAMLDRIGELLNGLREVSDNIAHDLKTPLTRLRNRADEALRSAESPDALRAALEANIEESDNLIRIFNALLMIARLEAGSAGEIQAHFDTAEAVRAVAELYDAAAEEAGIPLVVSAPDHLPIRGNRELLGQAVANLLDNALKYGRNEAGLPVRVSAMRNGAMVEVTISDSGPGIPQAERDRVLERFVRLESARTRPGFGLGLSLVAAVARLHGGSFRLEENGPGLRAILSLPTDHEQAPFDKPGGDNRAAGTSPPAR
ncbi:sensor histidine kinase [Microvirga massiliensis]|uniref:sensor histidine kinase n=1 Tax=Microvirga massiliensis TaxID=1033741 RepID=UPI00062BE521|nr:HAMP domain-containing sensor histidine kinase [Microvirga massiliensis]